MSPQPKAACVILLRVIYPPHLEGRTAKVATIQLVRNAKAVVNGCRQHTAG